MNQKFKIWDKVLIKLEWYDLPHRIWTVDFLSFYSEWQMLWIWKDLYYDFNARKCTKEEVKQYFTYHSKFYN